MQKLKSLYQEFTSFEGSLFKYSLSFSLLLALAPSLLIFALLFKYAYLDNTMIIDVLMNFVPDGDGEIVNQLFAFFTSKDYSMVSFIVTMAASFYLASRSIFSFLLISASHERVHVPKWAIRIKSVYLFIAFVLVVLCFIFISTYFVEFLPIVSSCVMLIFFYMMYRSLSFRKRDWSFGLLGALFSTISVMCLMSLFVTIVKHFTSYQDVYGPLASLVTLLLAIYIISCIIYFGFCLNLVCEDSYGREERLPMKNARLFTNASQINSKIEKKVIRKL